MPDNQDIKNIAAVIEQAVPAERIYLFGSYAYGQPDANSDYDFFVVLPDGGMRPMEAMQKAQRAIYPMRLSKPVDVLASTQSSFDAMRDTINSVEKEVAQKGVLLFERRQLGA